MCAVVVQWRSSGSIHLLAREAPFATLSSPAMSNECGEVGECDFHAAKADWTGLATVLA
jgi:hypothetical protein